MANEYSFDELLDFLDHARERGLLPAATAAALGVASRNVLGILAEDERADVRALDIDAVLRRFENRRAKEINPSSLREYGRRVRRAIQMFVQWRASPADFSVKTRSTSAARKRNRAAVAEAPPEPVESEAMSRTELPNEGTYRSAFPVRPGVVVTISNVPADLTPAEAERLAQFVRLLALG